MNGVVIFGYYGQKNLGDETNLRELVALIRETNPKLSITVISGTPEETAQKFAVSTIGKFNFLKIFFTMRKSRLVIGGGGSLFQDRTSLRSLFYYCTLVLLAKICTAKVMMYGQGIGPLRSRIGKAAAGLALSMVDLITVRDRLSVITLAELNVRKPEIFITAEPLLLLNELPGEGIAEYWMEYPSEKRLKVGLIIQEYGFMKKKFWSQLLECLYWDQNIEVYLLPATQQDYRFLQELADRTDTPILSTQNSWEEMQKAVGGLDLVASSRLHGLVAAVVQDIPCFGLVVDPKIEGFCLQLGVPFVRPTDRTEWLTIGNRLLNFVYQPLDERKPWKPQLSFWKARALENQLVLKKLITGNQ